MFKVKDGISISGKVITGSGINEVITAADIGTMAYQNIDSLVLSDLAVDRIKFDDTDSSYYTYIQSTSSNTDNRTLTLDINNANRLFNVGGNFTLANDLITSGNYSITLTSTGITNVTFPTSGTLTTTTGTDATGTWSISVSGNANTATTLATTRTIWGQNFNGSANITGALSSVTTVSMSGQLTSTLTNGTAPFVLASSTVNTNLNADMVDGKHVGTSGNTVPLLDGTNVWSAAQTFRGSNLVRVENATTQDAVILAGRAGGTSSYATTFIPATLSANRTITIPNVSGTLITSGDTDTVTNAMLAGSIANSKLVNSTISGIALGSNLNTLTCAVSGTGLSGSATYNGSGAATFTVTSNATSSNTVSTVVARDASGNFSAGTITASLAGNAATATTLQTARLIGGVSFNGSSNINLPGVNATGNQDTTGNAATVTNGVVTTGSYADPSWITSLAKSKIGLSNVDNTSDINKPISTATQTALNGKEEAGNSIKYAIALG